MTHARSTVIVVLLLAAVFILMRPRHSPEHMTAQLGAVTLPAKLRADMDRSVAYVVLSSYVAALAELGSGAKPTCKTVIDKARTKLDTSLNGKLTGFEAQTKRGVKLAADQLFVTVGAYVRARHCTASSNAALVDAAKLKDELASLALTFNTGVGM